MGRMSKEWVSNHCLVARVVFSGKADTTGRLSSPFKTSKAHLSIGILLLLLASHAVRASRREESTPTLLATAVATILTADCTADAVEHAGDEQAGRRGPHEGVSLDAQLCALAVALEGIPALNEDGAEI